MAATIPPGFDKALALKLANASMLAYNQFNDPAQFTMPPGYTLAAQFTADVLGNMEPFGFVMKSATDAVLAFRGTDDFPDDIADIRFNQATYPYASNAGLTHIGFTQVYESCRAAVDRRRDRAARGHHALHHRPQSGSGGRDAGRARRGRQYAIQAADHLHHRQPARRRPEFCQSLRQHARYEHDLQLARREYVRPRAALAPEGYLRSIGR